ncbi:MAG: pentapeptide repeat-containing protein [Cyanobacteria bacterium J06650_10]
MVKSKLVSDDKERLSREDRQYLIQTLNALPEPQFDNLVFVLDVPKGNIPGNGAPQGIRSKALLDWAESPIGIGLLQLERCLDKLLPPSEKTGGLLGFVISGKIDRATQSEVQAFVLLLQKKMGNNSIDVAFVEEGSIKIILSGSADDLEKLQVLLKSDELENLGIAPIEDIYRVDTTGREARKARLLRVLKLREKYRVFQLTSALAIARSLSIARVVSISAASALAFTLTLALTLFLAHIRTYLLTGDLVFCFALAFIFVRIRSYLLTSALNTKSPSDLDLRTADLRGVKLPKFNFCMTDLAGADLRFSDFTEADLTGVNLTGVNLSGATLARADLTGVNLSGATLAEVDFTGANLTDANLTDANLTDANLVEVNLTRAELAKANLSKVSFIRANLIGANFLGADLTESYLSSANVTRAVFGENFGITDLDKKYLMQRGAIFQDPPTSDVFSMAMR